MIELDSGNFNFNTQPSKIYVFKEKNKKINKFYVVSDRNRLLVIDASSELTSIKEFGLKIYHNENLIHLLLKSPEQVQSELSVIIKQDLVFLFEAEFILGIIKMADFSVMVFGTKSVLKGSIFANEVLKITKIEHIVLFESKLQTSIVKLSGIINYLSKDIHNYCFSKTYDLSKTLQMNSLSTHDTSRLNFIINREILSNFHALTHPEVPMNLNKLLAYWSKSCIYCFFDQFGTEIYSNIIEIIIIARKDCRNLGTRYNRRGFNEKAFVSNLIEVEQIVWNKTLSTNELIVSSSFVHLRGSVPMYWYQDMKMFDPKPQIKVAEIEDSETAMMIHFDDLFGRYGSNIWVLNLLFQKQNYLNPKSEANLGEEYNRTISKIIEKGANSISYSEIDLKNLMKVNKENLFHEISNYFSSKKEKIGKFLLTKMFDKEAKCLRPIFSVQTGVIRSNCVDCLDRTNIAQSAMSLLMIEEQIEDVLNFHISRENCLKYNTSCKIFLNILIQEKIFKIWESLGDFIAIDYTGSEAHNLEAKDKTKLLVKRYISNIFSDKFKQVNMNILQNVSEHIDNRFVFDLDPIPDFSRIFEKDTSLLFNKINPNVDCSERVEQNLFLLKDKSIINWLIYQMPTVPIGNLINSNIQTPHDKIQRFNMQVHNESGDKNLKKFENQILKDTVNFSYSLNLDSNMNTFSKEKQFFANQDESKTRLRFDMNDLDLENIEGVELIDPDVYLRSVLYEIPKKTVHLKQLLNFQTEVDKINTFLFDTDVHKDKPRLHSFSVQDFNKKSSKSHKKFAEVNEDIKIKNVAEKLCLDVNFCNNIN